MSYHGINGLEGVEPVGAVLRVGRKRPGDGRNRPPIERDRFFVCLPREDQNGDRPMHPAFAAFHAAAPEKRRAIRAVFVHATEREAWSYQLSAWRLPKLAAPVAGPACAGDGCRATRRIGEAKTEIVCPNDRCEYRIGNEPPCKPLMRVLFRPVWPDGNPLPTPLMRFESRSWHSTKAWLGLFQHVAAQAAHMGLASPSLWGFPFMITLGEESRRGTSQRDARVYPVVRVAPLADVQSFLAQQREIGLARTATMLDEAQHTDVEITAAHRALESAPAGRDS